MNRIVTISREFGSGGRTIGRKLAEKLNIPCYDNELIEKIATQSGFTPSYVEAVEESNQKSFLSSAFSNRYHGPSNEDRLWSVQRDVILDLAEKESCVIVGRCADFILRDRADLLSVFIHADLAYRCNRVVTVYGESDVSAEDRVKEKDKRRAAYHRFYTNEKWGQAKNYDICLDSGRLGLERCVDLLASLY